MRTLISNQEDTCHEPLSHLVPILPAGHWHSPISGEQEALTQSHR